MNQSSSLTSIMSFPDRGPWGKSSWRGNASGHVFKALFEQLKPKVFIDPMVGSGTSVDVAREMAIEAYGLDLHSGFNALRDSILQRVGKQADLCFSHPPYGGMIKYSGPGGQWGDVAHPDDLSHCESDEDFHCKMQAVLLNQRAATKSGGHYGTLIGDWRRKGIYTSYMAEMLSRMPSDELAAVLIKTQHNCVSDSRTYSKMTYPMIQHEYILLWKKKARPVLVLLADMVSEQSRRVQGTWKNIVKAVLQGLGGKATLEKIYAAVSNAAPERLETNQFWKEKVRQTLNQNASVFQQLDRGLWAVAA